MYSNSGNSVSSVQEYIVTKWVSNLSIDVSPALWDGLQKQQPSTRIQAAGFITEVVTVDFEKGMNFNITCIAVKILTLPVVLQGHTWLCSTAIQPDTTVYIDDLPS